MRPRSSWLFPLMLLAAVSASVFSFVGLAAITGHLALVPMVPGLGKAAQGGRDAASERRVVATQQTGEIAETNLAGEAGIRLSPVSRHARECPPCGVVYTIDREVSGRQADIVQPGPAKATGAAALLVPEVFVVRVRLDDGSYRTVREPSRPRYRVGDRVHLVAPPARVARAD